MECIVIIRTDISQLCMSQLLTRIKGNKIKGSNIDKRRAAWIAIIHRLLCRISNRIHYLTLITTLLSYNTRDSPKT
jgi:hypothetical protein